jgi:radical SAM superfamily enzyme YgiQ (UPF0313 family)
LHDLRKQRLARERGTLKPAGRRAVALVYPSPYPVGMSSLGYQSIYRQLNELPDTGAERAFLPDTGEDDFLRTYESGRAVGDFPVLAFSISYELELSGLLRCLQLAGVPLLHRDRGPRHPLVIAGGPLSFSNPMPLAPFVDAIVMGEAESLLAQVAEACFAPRPLQALADVPSVWVPSRHGTALPAMGKAHDTLLPAVSTILTPDSVLADMFLIEPERGCSRACSFCVMRRSTNGGMRLVPPARVMEAIPAAARRVGLVGAAVTDHPRIVDIVEAIVASGREVGISSLRADRLTPRFVELLAAGGYRTLTVASDGASEALRIGLLKKIRGPHLLRAAELVATSPLKQLKVYMMVGIPGETDEDIDELAEFSLEQAKRALPKRVALSVSPFVAKRNTPLDGTAFAGIQRIDQRIQRLRKLLRGRVDLRPSSSRTAWLEYQLAQGGIEAGHVYLRGWLDGDRFSGYRAAFAERLAA